MSMMMWRTGEVSTLIIGYEPGFFSSTDYGLVSRFLGLLFFFGVWFRFWGKKKERKRDGVMT